MGRGFSASRENGELFWGGAVKQRRVQLTVRGEGTSGCADLPGAIVPTASLGQQWGGSSLPRFYHKRC